MQNRHERKTRIQSSNQTYLPLPEFVVFSAGAVIMVLEMVGARIMAPHVGTSVIVWTSLIGVMLAFLALGAMLGGRMADKKLSSRVLALILLGAGAGAGIIPVAHRLFGAQMMEACPNVYAGAVAGAVVYFALPATLFGMVTPYIVRLRLRDITSSGSTVGRLYALSTIGSIVGTFLGGFVLISFFSCTQILLAVAAAGALLSLFVRRGKNPPALCLAVLALGGAFGNASYMGWQIRQGALPTVETPYNHIRVYEGFTADARRVRLIQTDPGKIQSAMYLDDPEALYCEYTRYIALAGPLFSGFRRVLVLGGGGYSIPRWLLAKGKSPEGLEVDVVELDPGMTKVTREYFSLPDTPRLRVHHEDARRFLNRNAAVWDVIFVDVFNSWYSVPFQMGTEEAALALRRAADPRGAVMMNVISAFSGEKGALFQAIHANLKEAFAEVHVFAVDPQSGPDEVQNLLLLALPEKRPDLAAIFAGAHGALPDAVRRLLRTRITRPVAAAAALSDDFAPVERYAQKLLD
ncbi:MAG: fused MFS/spermidine synthase [Desulfovibrio sp.]|jgi:spermidine synthase|nr:fused MFS/spermidine synthase [Desulfovibrio sp.]